MRNVNPVVYILAVIIILTVILVQPRVYTFLIASIPPRLPLPQITRGEFPFRIEYTLEGETFIVEDIYIAEFAGIGFNAGVGRFRRWNGYIQSTNLPRVPVLVIDESRTIYISVGGPAYYMGDESIVRTEPFIPGFVMVERRANSTGISWQEAIFSPYDVEIINWKLSAPIVNTFR